MQHWHDHFAWNDDFTLIIGLTAAGRATVAGLQMNLDDIVQARLYWLRAGWKPPSG